MTPTLKRVIDRNVALVDKASTTISALLKNRTAEITSDFNDQPYGRSKKSLKGRRFRITNAFPEQAGVTVWLDGVRCGARLWHDVIVVDESQSNTERKP